MKSSSGRPSSRPPRRALATPRGGTPASVGHSYAFGNTEEKARRLNMGCKARGQPGQPFSHKTGHGYVKARRGFYHDAIFVKRNNFNLLLHARHLDAQGARVERQAAREGWLQSRRPRGRGMMCAWSSSGSRKLPSRARSQPLALALGTLCPSRGVCLPADGIYVCRLSLIHI